MFPHALEYVAPASLDEAAEILAQEGDDAKVLAGGQSLLPRMKLRLAAPRLLVDVGRIAELGAGARFADGGLGVGARATHAALERRGDLAEQYPLRSAADWGAVLLALEGELDVLMAHAMAAVPPHADWLVATQGEYDHDALLALAAPAGLDVSAVTPQEIAVSIAAQLIEHRRRRGRAKDPTQAISPAAASVDPVCGMAVRLESTPHRATHAGVVYGFCSQGCLARFVGAPDAFLPAPGQPVGALA